MSIAFKSCKWVVQEEEFYAITWEAKKEVVFELPTGGAAIMRQVTKRM
jgi:hypothetical protein